MHTGGVPKAMLVTRRRLISATGVMSGGIVLAACGAAPATALTTGDDAPAAQESEPESAEPVTISYWAYGGFATPDGHGYVIVEKICEETPDINARVLPIPVGLGASAL